MKKIAAIAFIFCFCLQVVSAQQTKSVKKYKATITTKDTTTRPGYLVSMTDTTILLLIKVKDSVTHKNVDRVFSYDYRSIERASVWKAGHRSSVAFGILIGSVGGAIIGGVIGDAAGKKQDKEAGFAIVSNEGSEAVAGVVIGAVGGGLIGALVGVAIHKTFIIDFDKTKFQLMRSKLDL